MIPAKTSTGGYAIGFRRGGGAWQQPTGALAAWAVQNGFDFVDLGRRNVPADLAVLTDAGLTVGSVDLLDREGYGAMIAPDSPARRAAVAATLEHIAASARAGAKVFFTVTVPADPGKPRRENFDCLVESFAALIPALEQSGARVAIEGWPGAASVCCTPETFRAFFRAVGSDRFGVNYDPSHLLRMGIDPLRFLREFADRVFHVHAKDTALSAEGLYEFGHELPPALAEPRRWSGGTWRYTIPGHGAADWPGTFRVLAAAGYRGLVSVELEDEHFAGTDAGEQRGLVQSREFLAGC